MSETMERMVRLYLSEGETGWAVDLGEWQYRIANIPFNGEFNIDDVVEVDKEAGHLKAKTLVSRKYPVRTAVWVDKPDQLGMIIQKLEKIGGKAEGFMKPDGGRQGIVGLALLREEDATGIVADLGAKQPESWTANQLER